MKRREISFEGGYRVWIGESGTIYVSDPSHTIAVTSEEMEALADAVDELEQEHKQKKLHKKILRRPINYI